MGGRHRNFGAWLLVLSLLTAGPFSLQAATRDWTGSSSNFNNAGSWSPGSAPGSGDVARFGSAFTGSNQPTLSGNMTIGQLLFASGLAKNVTINTGANTLTLAGVSGLAIDNQQTAHSVTIAGNLAFQGAQTIAVADGAAAVDLDISANILDMWYTSLTKTGAGTLRLSGNNTFQGPLTISGGTVIAASNSALGASVWNNSVANGAALHLTGGITLNQGSIEVAGTGPDGLGAIRSLSGNNAYNGVLTTTGVTKIGIQSGAGLTLGGSNVWNNVNHELTIENSGTFQTTAGTSFNLNANLIFNGNGNATIASNQLSGGGTIIKNGSGTLTFNGSGTFSPYAMDVREGTVELNRLFNPGNKSGLSIGTTSGPAAALRLLSNENLRDDLVVTIRESGTLDLNHKNESIAAINFYGGTVNTGTGTLTLANAGGDVITANSSTQTASINGKLELAQDNLQAVTITVADSALETELNINAAISQKNPSIQTLLVKNGAGTLEFSGNAANTYTGVTRINGGTLKLNKTAGVDAVAGGRIEVNSGGTLLLASANQINNSVNLTLNGGTFSTGATTGFSDKLGKLTLSANSVIDLGSGVHWLEFAASNDQIWNGSATLTIYDWVGVGGQSGTQGRIYVGTNVNGLTASQLSQISFQGFGVGAMLLADGELVPIAVPEASVVIAVLLIGAVLGWRERQFLGRLLAGFRPKHSSL